MFASLDFLCWMIIHGELSAHNFIVSLIGIGGWSCVCFVPSFWCPLLPGILGLSFNPISYLSLVFCITLLCLSGHFFANSNSPFSWLFSIKFSNVFLLRDRLLCMTLGRWKLVGGICSLLPCGSSILPCAFIYIFSYFFLFLSIPFFYFSLIQYQ